MSTETNINYYDEFLSGKRVQYLAQNDQWYDIKTARFFEMLSSFDDLVFRIKPETVVDVFLSVHTLRKYHEDGHRTYKVEQDNTQPPNVRFILDENFNIVDVHKI